MTDLQSTYTPPAVINDSTVQENQNQAASLGVKIPGVGSGLTTADQDATKAANQGKPGYDALGNAVQDQGIDTARINGGTYTGMDGNQYYKYDNSAVNFSPTGQDQGTQNGTQNTDQGTPALADQTDRTALAQAQEDFQAQAKQVSDTISGIQNGTTPLSASETAQISGLQQQFQTLVDQQNLTNKGATGIANVRGYQTGAAEYDANFQVKTIGAIASAGAAKVADLQTKEAAAVAQLTQSFKDNDIKAVQDAWDVYQSASKDRTDALQKTITDTQQAIKDAQDAKIAADKVQYDEVTAPIQALQKEAAQFNAPADVLAKIGAATNVADALTAGQGYFQDPTSIGGQYSAYVKQATAAGQTPLSPWAFLSKQKATDAYNAAYEGALGKAAGEGTAGTNSDNGLSSLPSSAQSTLQSNGFTSFNSSTQNLAIQLATGQLAPSELSKRTTGSSSYNDILTAADKYSMATTGQHFDISKADRQYKFATNTQTQNTLNYLGSLVGSDDGNGNLSGGNLDQLISLSNARISNQNTGNVDYAYHASQGLPPLNDVSQWAKIQAGDPQMAAYYATLLEVSDQVAKVLQGGGTGSGTSDSKLAQAQGLFQKGFTPDQVSAVATQMKDLLATRASSMVKDNPYLSDYASQFGVQTDNGVTTTNQKIMQDETTAEGKISAFYNMSADNKKLIDDIHNQFPNMSAQEVTQQLGI